MRNQKQIGYLTQVHIAHKWWSEDPKAKLTPKGTFFTQCHVAFTDQVISPNIAPVVGVIISALQM
jgi:hypothetical protein